MAIAYGNVYVAQIAMGANDNQTVKAFMEAEAYEGPSILIAYSHCIAHGYDLKFGMDHQKAAGESGSFPLYRYNPALAAQGQNPLKLDSKSPRITYADWAMTETRFRMLTKSKPELAKKYMEEGQAFNQRRWKLYEQLASQVFTAGETKE